MPKRLVSAIAVGVYFLCTAITVAQEKPPKEPPQEAAPAETKSADELLNLALQAKLEAENLLDLGEVITLCDRALAAGLKGESKGLAEKMLAGALVQRGTALTQTLTRTAPGNLEELQQLVRIRQLALDDLQRAVDLDPQAEPHVLLAKLYSLRKEEHDQAKKSLNAAIKIASSNTLKGEAYLLRSSLQTDDKLRQADLDEAVKLDPNDYDIRAERANYLFEQKKFEDALAEANKAIELDNEEPLTYQLRGLILASTDKLDEATKDFDKAIDMGLNSALVYARRAQLHLLNQKPEQAVNDLNKALARTRPTPQLLLLRAGAYQQLEKDKEALQDVDTALTLSPGLPEALRARAMLLAGSGDIAKAIVDLEKLRDDEDQGKDQQLLLQLAMLYSANKESRQAIEIYTQVIKEDEKNFLAYQGRADAHLRLGEQTQALADYAKAIELNPDSSHILNNMAWLLATSPDEKIRNGTRSIELAKKACELSEYKQAHILSTLAAGYAETGDFKTAIEWSQKAVELSEEGIDDQLKQELKSYQAKKPWRELVNEEEDAKTTDEDKPATP